MQRSAAQTHAGHVGPYVGDNLAGSIVMPCPHAKHELNSTAQYFITRRICICTPEIRLADAHPVGVPYRCYRRGLAGDEFYRLMVPDATT